MTENPCSRRPGLSARDDQRRRPLRLKRMVMHLDEMVHRKEAQRHPHGCRSARADFEDGNEDDAARQQYF
jgi:hypothetical protein